MINQIIITVVDLNQAVYLPLLSTEAVSVGEGAGEVQHGPCQHQHQLACHHLHHTATWSVVSQYRDLQPPGPARED